MTTEFTRYSGRDVCETDRIYQHRAHATSSDEKMRYENAYGRARAIRNCPSATGIPIAVGRFTYDLKRSAYEIFFIRVPTLCIQIFFINLVTADDSNFSVLFFLPLGIL